MLNNLLSFYLSIFRELPKNEIFVICFGIVVSGLVLHLFFRMLHSR